MALTQQYNCQQGQTYTDVVLNTYGTMDLYVKFLNDNNLTPDSLPYSNQSVIFDPTLIDDETTATLINNGSIVYSTGTNNAIPAQPQPVSQYQETQPQAFYTASVDGETSFTIVDTQNPGTIIISLTKEIKGLEPSQYTFVPTTGVFTLLGGLSLAKGETIYVIYSIPATTT